jgi:hypothetical protein
VVRRVLFIADQFADSSRTPGEKHPGGAELTDAAAIDACPWSLEVAHTTEVAPRDLIRFDVHVVANFQEAQPRLVAEMTRLGRHVLFEHDVRICVHRGNYPAALNATHRSFQRCVCPFPHLDKLIRSARGMIFLTHLQLAHYLRNPFFRAPRVEVLGSSLMNEAFFERVKAHRRSPPHKSLDAAVVYSKQGIKGFEQSLACCEERGWAPHVIRDVTPEEVLDTLERSRRLVSLPIGLEPSGRLYVEARMLGCDVVTNANAGVCGESWWRLPDPLALETLRDAPARFWRLVNALTAEDVRIVPERSDARTLVRGHAWADRFNTLVRVAERWLVPRRLIEAADQRRDARSRAASVVATGSDDG